VKDKDCREFLDWALPLLGFRRAGFHHVRGQVCKRIARRMHALDLPDPGAYRQLLDADPAEWAKLESFCRITISRFCRDRQVFEWLGKAALPGLANRALAQDRAMLRCWSAGCGGGEEPYTLRILWDLCLASRFPALRFDIVATDVDPAMLARARRAVYRAGTLRELSESLVAGTFTRTQDEYRLRQAFQTGIRFLRQDIRQRMPRGPFDLVLCRNLVFTYFDEAGQRRVLRRIARRMTAGGVLLVGRNERLPADAADFGEDNAAPGAYHYRGPA
jgi:chemotaxis protein methyltransferase CheR